jgi:hypothetical protein
MALGLAVAIVVLPVPRHYAGDQTLVVGAAVLAAVAFLVIGLFGSRALAADARAGTVMYDEGTITPTSDPWTNELLIYVDNRQYGPVSRRQWDAVGAPRAGRLYYLPDSRRVVNIERDPAEGLPR